MINIIEITQTDINQVINQSIQNVYVEIELLNSDFKIIDKLEGELINGSINIDSESDVRRSASIQLYVKDDTYLVSNENKIWIDRFARILINVKNQRTQDYLKYDMGTFLFNQNSYSYDIDTKELNCELLDLMCTFTGVRNGQVRGLDHTIPVDSEIRDAIISTITESGVSYDYKIVDIDRTVPYDLEFSTGATVYDMLVALKELYSGYEMFFDGNIFVYQRIPTCIEDDVFIDATDMEKIVVSENLSNSFESVKNVSDVWGKCIEGDFYADSSTSSGNQYNISIENFTLKQGVKVGFKTNTKITNPTLKVGNEDAYPIVLSNGEDVVLEEDTSYIVRYSLNKYYLQGRFQIHGIVKEVSAVPTDAERAADIEYENCFNIKYVVNPDSPYCIDKIGEIRQVLSGDEYDNIYTDELSIERAEYENWKATRLQDSIDLETVLVPWFDVNKKLEYKSNITKEIQQYIIKSIDMNFSDWTMNVNMIRFYPEYPYIIESI